MSHIEAILSKYQTRKREDKPSEAIINFESEVGFTLPEDYRCFLLNYYGFENSIGEEYVRLWDLNELLKQNEEYFILENLSSTVGIGSNGAGELIALEKINDRKFRVVITPFVDLSEEYHIQIGNSFTDFLQRLDDGQEWFNEREN